MIPHTSGPPRDRAGRGDASAVSLSALVSRWLVGSAPAPRHGQALRADAMRQQSACLLTTQAPPPSRV